MLRPWEVERRDLYVKLALALIFALAFVQFPLYSSNQNTYFLHGLANAGWGHLGSDWLAQTADPFPVFSALVTATVLWLGEPAFYWYHVGLLMAYGYALVGIVCHVYRIRTVGSLYISISLLLTLLYAGAVPLAASRAPIGVSVLMSVAGYDEVLTDGVAGQFMPGPFLQPSAFGIFLVVSIYNFLQGRRILAIALVAFAICFHSSYLLTGAWLTIAYAWLVYRRDRAVLDALSLSGLSLLLVLPTVVYLLWNFGAGGAETALANRILVDYRMPHHAHVSEWLDGTVLFKLVMIALALWIARGTQLTVLLGVPLVASLLLTAYQLATDDARIALLFPWRTSVILVPIASAVLLGGVVVGLLRALPAYRGPVLAGSVGMLVTLGGYGVDRMTDLLASPRVGGFDVAAHVEGTYRDGEVLLIPPQMQELRLLAGVPVLADFKSHPYESSEVVEWYERLTRASAFYEANGDRCRILEGLRREYAVTHVVLPRTDPPGCSLLQEEYAGEEFSLFVLQRDRRSAAMK